MREWFNTVFESLPPGTFWTIAIVSVVAFVGTLVAIPFVLIRLPEHYFDVRVRRTWMKDRHPVLRAIGLTVKNLFGVVFLAAGLAMLLLPGQGLLTILIGITLLDFPGKQRLEAGIVGRPKVLSVINDLRRRFDKPAFVIAPKPGS